MKLVRGAPGPTGIATGTGTTPAYCAPKKAMQKPGHRVGDQHQALSALETRADQAAGEGLQLGPAGRDRAGGSGAFRARRRS